MLLYWNLLPFGKSRCLSTSSSKLIWYFEKKLILPSFKTLSRAIIPFGATLRFIKAYKCPPALELSQRDFTLFSNSELIFLALELI